MKTPFDFWDNKHDEFWDTYPHGECKSDSGIEAYTIAISFNFILGLIIACLWCLSFVR